MITERTVRLALIVISLLGLIAGLVAYTMGDTPLAHWIWGAATVPVVIALAVSIARDLSRGRMGVDAIAFLSMTAALALGQSLAGIVVAIMYAGGTVLEDFAVARAERSLKSLVDRAPRIAHRRTEQSVEDVHFDRVPLLGNLAHHFDPLGKREQRLFVDILQHRNNQTIEHLLAAPDEV